MITKEKSIYSLLILLMLLIIPFLISNKSPILSPNLPLSSANEIVMVTPENITYTTPMSGYYPGTYGFEDEPNGDTGEEIRFVSYDQSESGCYSQIIPELDGHKKVLETHDGNPSGRNQVTHHFEAGAQTFGSIEFWFRVSNVNLANDIYFIADAGGYGIMFGVNSGYFRYNGIGNIVACSSNTWYHIKLEFECTTGNYQGLSQYSWHVYIDGLLYGDYGYLTNKDDVRSMMFYNGYWAESGGYYYYDAFGFSWDSDYSLGANLEEGLLLSYSNNTNLDWVGYSLDGQANKTILGNKTFSMPDYGVHSVQIYANNSLGDDYSSGLQYFTYSPINLITPENKTYTQPLSGYYPATYGFENDLIGADPNDWSDISTSDCDIEVVDEFNEHKNVARGTDNRVGYSYNLRNYFGNRSFGTIEWWWALNDVSENQQQMTLLDHVPFETLIGVRMSNSGIESYSGGVWNTITGPITGDNIWYHFRIDFETTTSNYLGLLQYQYTISLNEDKYGPFNFNVDDNPFYLNWYSGAATTSTVGYLDAVGYSWDSDYDIGNNLNEGLLLGYNSEVSLDWIGYSLDGQSNNTISGNKTIPFPSNGLHTIQLHANISTGDYYKTNLRYFTVDYQPLTLISPENTTYVDPMSGYYPATFGFDGDSNGDVPEGWYRGYPGEGDIQVYTEIGGHKKVVELIDSSTSGYPYLRQTFNPQTTGTVEFYIRKESGTTKAGIEFRSSTTVIATGIRIDYGNNGKFEAYQGAGYLEIGAGLYSDQEWFHVKIEFDTLTDTADFYINGNLLASNVAFMNTVSDIDRILFAPNYAYTGSFFIDAVGYSWDSEYDIGNNLNEGMLLGYNSEVSLDWIGYSLDSQSNSTISGNKTIPFPRNGLHTIQLHANISTGNYYKTDLRYFTIDYYPITLITPENTTYVDPMSGYYPATFGFENDLLGDNPLDWSIIESGGPINIVDNIGGHNNVVEMYDTSGSSESELINYFSRTSGTIEYWLRVNTLSMAFGMFIGDGGYSNSIYMVVDDTGNFRYTDDGAIWKDITSFSANQWYHLKIEFDCTTNWHLWIDNVSMDGGLGYDYWGAPLTMDQLHFRTYVSALNYRVYIDAVAYSWDPDYSIGDNLNEGILLSFNSKINLDWIGYSLDGQPNKTIIGNTTIIMPEVGPHSIQVFGNDTSNNFYQSTLRYFTISPFNLITPENKTYNYPMTGYYPATYGFENVLDGTFPSDWTILTTGGTMSIISESNSHKKVLELYDTSGSNKVECYQEFTPRTTGIIEFWLKVDSSTTEFAFFIGDNGEANSIYMAFLPSGYIAYYDTTWNNLMTYSANQWYHFRIEWDISTDWHLWIDQISQDGGLGYDYRGTPSSFNWVFFRTANSPSNYKAWVDAVGYSWNPSYSIGDNIYEGLLVSYENSTNLDWIGLSFDGQPNRTILGNTVIPFPTDGLHSLIIVANDTTGVYYSSDLRYFFISTVVPTISISSPLSSQYFGVTAPSYIVDPQGVNLDKMWYSLDNGLTNISFTSSTGTINQVEWDKLSHGPVMLIFYTNDSLGRIASDTITFNKDLNAPTTSIYYTLYNPPNMILRSTLFTLSFNDNSESGVSITRYRINGSTWITYTGGFTLENYGAGDYMITYQSIDAVGNAETEKSVIVELYIPPPPPPDLSFIIYIVIGVVATLAVILYIAVIRPKTATKRLAKKEEHTEQKRLKRVYQEQQRAEKERIMQQRMEQQRLERERILRQQQLERERILKEQAERQRLERERIEEARRQRELERLKQIEIAKQKRLEEERAIIDKIRKVMNVSTRVKMDLLRSYLKMNELTFNEKIFDWAAQFGFTIDGDYLNIRKENVSNFIDELEKQFSTWRKSEDNRLDKI